MKLRRKLPVSELQAQNRPSRRLLCWGLGLGAVLSVLVTCVVVAVVTSGPPPARATILDLNSDRVEAQLRGSGATSETSTTGANSNDASSAGVGDLGPRDSEEHLSYPEPESKKSKKFAGLPAVSGTTHPSDGVASEAQLRKDVRELRRDGKLLGPSEFRLLGDGSAEAPFGAPSEIQSLVAAANEIAHFPYRWGGGHGSFVDNAYDCSGSLSYAMAAAGMVTAPLVSGDLASWGAPGPGKWLTVYAHGGHTFMIVGGLRYDTSGRSGPRGSRWQTAKRSDKGFTVRHWPGL